MSAPQYISSAASPKTLRERIVTLQARAREEQLRAHHSFGSRTRDSPLSSPADGVPAAAAAGRDSEDERERDRRGREALQRTLQKLQISLLQSSRSPSLQACLSSKGRTKNAKGAQDSAQPDVFASAALPSSAESAPHGDAIATPIDFDSFHRLIPFIATEEGHTAAHSGGGGGGADSRLVDTIRIDGTFLADRALPIVQWPMPSAALRVQGRRMRDEQQQRRRERRRRRQQRRIGSLPFRSSAGAAAASGAASAGEAATAVAARLLSAATSGAAFFESAVSPRLRHQKAASNEGGLDDSTSRPRSARAHRQRGGGSPPSATSSPHTGAASAGARLHLSSPTRTSAAEGRRRRGANGSGDVRRDESEAESAATPKSFALRSPGSSGFFFSSSSNASSSGSSSSLNRSSVDGSSAFGSSSDSSTAAVFDIYQQRRQRRRLLERDGKTEAHAQLPGSPHSWDSSSPTSTLFNLTGTANSVGRRDAHLANASMDNVKSASQRCTSREPPSSTAAAATKKTRSTSANTATAGTASPAEGGSDGSGDDDLLTHRTAVAEMEAIEQGLTTPYRAYLFSPQARVIDVQKLVAQGGTGAVAEAHAEEGARRPVPPPTAAAGGTSASTRHVTTATVAPTQPQWGRHNHTSLPATAASAASTLGRGREAPPAPAAAPAAPPVEATCVAFSPAGTCYLVGCSQGTLVYVAVAPPAEGLTHTTYLGSVRRDAELPGAPEVSREASLAVTETAQTAVAGSTAIAAETGSTGTNAKDGQRPPSPAPVLLSLAHSAAVTSVAFSDDGAMFASASVDGSVMLWRTATQAKLRRLRVASPSPVSHSSAYSASFGTGAAGDAPLFVLFTPFNNNYLLVCSRQAGILYNGSTGLPVAVGHDARGGGGGGSGAGASGISRSGAGKTMASGGGDGSVTGLRRRSHATTPSFITSVCMSPDSAPFFFMGDSQGNVQMCTYRAGEVAALPGFASKKADEASAAEAISRTPSCGADPLRASPLPPTSRDGRGGDGVSQSDRAALRMGGGGDGGGAAHRHRPHHESNAAAFAIAHSRQLPELRRLAHLSLDYHSDATKGGGSSFSAPFYPIGRLEVCAVEEKQCQSILKAQQRLVPSQEAQLEQGLWPACEEQRQRRAQQQQHQQTGAKASTTTASSTPSAEKRSAGGRGDARGHGSGMTAGEHGLLSEVPNKIAGAFSSLLAAASSALGGGGGGGSSGGGQANRLPPSSKPARSPPLSTGLSHAAGELTRRLCPLMLLVTQPCDGVTVVGVHVEFPCRPAKYEDHHHRDHNRDDSDADMGDEREKDVGSRRGREGEAGLWRRRRRLHQHQQQQQQRGRRADREERAAPSGPPVYSLVRLLDIRSVCRVRHVGAGAVPCSDNPKLLAMALPCEEGFVRVVTSSVVMPHKPAVPTAAAPTPCASVSVAAMLPMPCGGRCSDLAWSPDSRFLVAVTREGVLYQWERIYLIGESVSAARAGRGTASGLPPRALTATAVGSAAGAATAAVNAAAAAAHGVHGRGGVPVGARPTHAQGSSGRAAALPAEFLDDLHSAGRSDKTAHRQPHTGHPSASPPATAAARAQTQTLQPSSLPHRVMERGGQVEWGEEEAWRESLFRERLRQLAVRRQGRENGFVGAIGGSGSGGDGDGESSSGYWLEEEAAGTSSSPSASADLSTND